MKEKKKEKNTEIRALKAEINYVLFILLVTTSKHNA